MEKILNKIDSKFNVIVIDSGEEALKVIKNNIIDLMFLDVNMPNMNGFDVIKNIRENELNISVDRIIMCTASSDYNTIQKCKTYGITNILNKPFNISSIKKILSEKL